MKKLDLHGIKHEDVRNEVIRAIESGWDSGEVLEIITGHSKEMKKLAKEVITEYDLPYKIGDELGINNNFIKVWL